MSQPAAASVRRADRPDRGSATGLEILVRWVTDPDRYTEVAENLPHQIVRYCDTIGDGWRAVADQWLQPAALAQDDFPNCYSLLYSTSEHFDAGLL